MLVAAYLGVYKPQQEVTQITSLEQLKALAAVHGKNPLEGSDQ